MKVRWTAESIRFRISPRELELLRTGESVSVTLCVPGGRWVAAIVPWMNESRTQLCGVEGSGITLHLATADLARLCVPEAEGVYFRTESEPHPLRYFIEKDFPCIHPRPKEAQEESETFVPPSGFAERHTPVSC